MFTFDHAAVPAAAFDFDEFRKSRMPDVVEVGETEEYWVRVTRSAARVDLVSKVSGAPFVFCQIEEAAGLLSPAHLSAARAAMRLTP